MKRRIPSLTIAFLSVLAPGLAAAAPGDPLMIHGRVLDPRGRFVTVTADNGLTYHADLAGLDRGSLRELRVGDFLTINGVEGSYPNEVRAHSVSRDNARRPASSADTFVYWDWRLPRNHQYETYSTSDGRYSVVDVTSVPTRIEAGEWIYDRTANAWVSHPSTGRNATYLAGNAATPTTREPDALFLDGWRLSRSHRYELYQQADGTYVPVDVSSVPSRIAAGDWIYDRTAGVWLSHPSVGRNTAYSGSQQLSGRVQGLVGNQLTLRTDGGRLVTVDLSDVSQRARRDLRWGDTVTVTGVSDTAGTFRAQSLDTGFPSALPRQ